MCLVPSFPNGYIASVVGTTYTPGDGVSVICDTGFKAAFINTTCNQSRLWNPLPSCSIVTCPAPVVDSGNYTASGDETYSNDFNATTEYTYNTTIVLECNDRFEATGPTTLTCLANGTWGQITSTCEKIICNDTSAVWHEAVTNITTHLGVYETGNASYNSENFFLSNGDIEIQCHENKKMNWTKTPTFCKCLILTSK